MDWTPTRFPPNVVGLTFFQAFMNVCECNVVKKLPIISNDIGPTKVKKKVYERRHIFVQTELVSTYLSLKAKIML